MLLEDVCVECRTGIRGTREEDGKHGGGVKDEGASLGS